MPDVKIRQITSAKIISPQWVVDCVKANRILDYSRYLLYTNHKVSQPKIAFKPKDLEIDTTKQTFQLPIDVNAQTENEIVACNTENNSCDLAEPPKEVFELNLDILNVAIRRHESEQRRHDKQILASMPRCEGETEGVTNTAPNTHSLNQNNMKKRPPAARTANDPNFLAEFYNNSRLHHIATLGASFKDYIWRMRESHNGQFPIRDRLKLEMQEQNLPKAEPINGKVVMHIDMDCFFVSVGLRTRPQLKGLPLAVTHSKGRNANNIQNIDGVNRKKEMELYVKRHEEKYHIDHGDGDAMPANPLQTIDNTISLSEIASCSYEARKMGIKNGMFVGQALKLCPKLQTIPYDFDAYKEVAHILYNTILQ